MKVLSFATFPGSLYSSWLNFHKHRLLAYYFSATANLIVMKVLFAPPIVYLFAVVQWLFKFSSGPSARVMPISLFAIFGLTAGPVYAQSSSDSTTFVLQTKDGQVKVERMATLVEPWGMTFLPDGRLLVTEKPGRLRIFEKGKLSEPIAGVPKVLYYGQGGLLDVEIDPAFATNKLVYLFFTEAADKQPDVKSDTPDHRLGPGQELTHVTLKGGAVARARLDGNTLKDLKVIWRQEPKQIGRGHFGGRLVFAPDGKLFITSGERQRFEPAQDSSSTLGKIIRINPDGSIPKDNPFVNRKGFRPDIWTLGHRNPLGAAINPVTKQLWMHEMGPMHGDELNVIEAGKNYGWPLVSNGTHYDGTKIPDHDTQPTFAGPLYFWHPAISPSGLMFYTGSLFSKWQGNLFLGGLSSQALIRLTLKDNMVSAEERFQLNKRVRDVIQAPDGSIWLLTDYTAGELLRLTPVAAQ
jgi:glucose/arabinose dehydrogenase